MQYGAFGLFFADCCYAMRCFLVSLKRTRSSVNSGEIDTFMK